MTKKLMIDICDNNGYEREKARNIDNNFFASP